MGTRGGGVGDQLHVDVALGGGRAIAIGIGEHPVLAERLDDLHPDPLAVPARSGRRRHPPEQLQRDARQVRARASVDGGRETLGGRRVVHHHQRGSRGAGARFAQTRVRHVTDAEADHRDVGMSVFALRARGLRELFVAQHSDGRVASRFLDQCLELRTQLGDLQGQLVLDAAIRVQHQEPARARPPEPGQPLDVRAQQRVDLRQGLWQHRSDLASEGLPGPRRIAVSNQHQIGERPQLSPGRERIARRRRRLQLRGGQVEDRQVEGFVREARQSLRDGVDLEHEAFAVQRTGDAGSFDAVAERHQKALLPAARSVAKDLQRLARAIYVYHLASAILPQRGKVGAPTLPLRTSRAGLARAKPALPHAL